MSGCVTVLNFLPLLTLTLAAVSAPKHEGSGLTETSFVKEITYVKETTYVKEPSAKTSVSLTMDTSNIRRNFSLSSRPLIFPSSDGSRCSSPQKLPLFPRSFPSASAGLARPAPGKEALVTVTEALLFD